MFKKQRNILQVRAHTYLRYFLTNEHISKVINTLVTY